MLERTEGGTSQEMERNRLSEGHSRTGDSRGRDLSGHGKKSADRVALTSWRRQREGLVRTWNVIHQERDTHSLETVE